MDFLSSLSSGAGSFLGGLTGGLTNLIGGMFGASKAKSNSIEMMNLAAQEQQIAQQDQIPNLVAGAKAAGLNPLLAVGVNPSSGPSSPAGDFGADQLGSGIKGFGQDIGRAITAYADKNDKTEALNRQLIEAKIHQVEATTAGQQLQNSQAATRLAAAGSPPTAPGKEKPNYQRYSSWPYSLLSHDAASTQFGPTSFVTGAELLPGLLWDQAKGTYEHVAPHVARAINNLSMPTGDAPIGNPAGDLPY